jgi:hypothetical protein
MQHLVTTAQLSRSNTAACLVTALGIVFGSLILACSPAQSGGAAGNGDPGDKPILITAPEPTADPGFPADWDQWDKLNEVTREGAGELRHLFANAAATAAPYPTGSVLIKAHYRLNAGAKGALFQLSVMKKTGDGWEWEAYAPNGSRRTADAEVCAMCHSQRAETDFVFSAR